MLHHEVRQTVVRTAGAVTLTGLESTGNRCDRAAEEQDQLVEDMLFEGPTVTVEGDFMTWTGRTLIVEFVDEEFEDKPQ
ncbi:MAG: hypothetical protein GY722_00815 [bacterium]|nr:hypothetical protein [bacterium]